MLVIDDHELVGETLVLALTERGISTHRVEVSSTQEVIESARRLDCALTLLDLDLGVDRRGAPVDEIALVKALTKVGSRCLIVSGCTDPDRVATAIAAGAVGYVSKAAPLRTLMTAVEDAAAGRAVMSAAERREWLQRAKDARSAERTQAARLARLTTREREVLERLARGDRAAAIAEESVVSLTTVRSQIRSILTKLEVNSQLEAAAMFRGD